MITTALCSTGCWFSAWLLLIPLALLSPPIPPLLSCSLCSHTRTSSFQFPTSAAVMMLQHFTAPAAAGAAVRPPGSSSVPASMRSSLACPSKRQQISSSKSSRSSSRGSLRVSSLQSGADPFQRSPAAPGYKQQPSAINASNPAADIQQQQQQQGGASQSAGCPFHQQDPAADIAPAGLTEAAAAAAVQGGGVHAHHSSSSNSSFSAALGVANLAGPGGCWRVLPNGNTDKVRVNCQKQRL